MAKVMALKATRAGRGAPLRSAVRERTRGDRCRRLQMFLNLLRRDEMSTRQARLRTFTSTRPCKPESVKEAVQLQTGAVLKRAVGRAMILEDDGHTGGRNELAKA
jgi:hypothetical protein